MVAQNRNKSKHEFPLLIKLAGFKHKTIDYTQDLSWRKRVAALKCWEFKWLILAGYTKVRIVGKQYTLIQKFCLCDNKPSRQSG